MSDPASLAAMLERAQVLLDARTHARATDARGAPARGAPARGGHARGGHARGERPADPVSAELDELMAAIETRVVTGPGEARPDEARRLAGRLTQARARYALQQRALPVDALDGLYEQVREGLTGESAWRRAGMSEAFLDAPRSLVVWRRVAVAACLVLAVGAGWSLRGEVRPEQGVRADMLRLVDPRDGLFEPATGGSVPVLARPGRMRSGARLRTVGARPPGGVILFNSAGRGNADARRMLDGVRIFPVPGRGNEEAEQN